jgi:membrane-bound lytic murein transglycosylase B
MVPPRDDDDRERPSWREIDQRRDGSRHRARDLPKVPKKQAEMLRKQALAQAEALFKGKRSRPEYQADLKRLEACYGSKKFPMMAKKFLEEYGLPEEWGVLTRFLDYSDPKVVVDVLQAMAGQMGKRSRVEQQGFKGRLQIMALTSTDADIRRAAEEVLGELSN